MGFEINGYYTKDACFAGKPEALDLSIVQTIVEEKKEDERACFPPYIPIIALPFSAQQCLRPPLVSPSFPQDLGEINDIVRSKPKYDGPRLKTLPWEVNKMKIALESAKARGGLIWLQNAEGKAAYSYLFWHLQSQIDCSLGDVHVLVGNDHPIAQQVGFFNNLISNISGITHLGLEAFDRGDIHYEENDIPSLLERKADWPVLFQHDGQGFIDYYLESGDARALAFFKESMKSRFKFSDEGVFNALVETFKIARDRGYEVLANDLSMYRLNNNLKNFTQKLPEQVAVREKMSVDWTEERLSPYKREVVLYFGGKSHTEQKALPVWIKQRDPSATVISIALNGGGFSDSWVFDVALKELGWEEKPFMLLLDGYREADLVVHLPNDGKVLGFRDSIVQYPLFPFVE